MEIYANAYYTFEPGDFVILTSGDIVCVKSHDKRAKTYTVTDAKPDGDVYNHKFVDSKTNKRTVKENEVYMPVHHDFSLNQDLGFKWC